MDGDIHIMDMVVGTIVGATHGILHGDGVAALTMVIMEVITMAGTTTITVVDTIIRAITMEAVVHRTGMAQEWTGRAEQVHQDREPGLLAAAGHRLIRPTGIAVHKADM